MRLSILKYFLCLFLVSSFFSCATYKTVIPSEQKRIIEYVDNMEGAECLTIPRVYSGVCYSFCVMTNRMRLKSDHSDVASLPLDFLGDTLLLPYTVIRQINDGNLTLKKPRPDSSIGSGEQKTGIMGGSGI